jgi:hypothetical protein
MNNLMQLVENEQTSEFYPTPQSLVEKMLEGIDWAYIHTILEPSAGKGDIVREIAKAEKHFRYEGHFDVDCIEIDPHLRQILKYNFGERKEVLRREHRSIRDKYKYCQEHFKKSYEYYNESTRNYEQLPPADLKRLKDIDAELDTFIKNGIQIVHDNFLTYNPFKQYDLIIMNPPFSNGDKHLLKALDIQKNGGNIICLLNAETIRNPYTETRKELLRQLKKHHHTIEYISDAFASAERRTGVEVALIKIAVEQVQEESDIYNRMKEAEKMEDFNPEATELEVTDYIKAAVSMFRVEVKAGLELIRQYRALIPYMAVGFGDDRYEKSPILRLTDSSDRGYDSVSVNEYLKKVRYKYWSALLNNPKFTGKLTSKLQKEYQERVDKLKNYDFTEFNIHALSTEMNAQIKRGIEEEIVAMFDRLTEEHSWYPECSKNKHLYDGWKTNKAHKIDKKVIIPTHGVWGEWDGLPRVYSARGVLEDIERILNFLDGNMTENVDSWSALDIYFKRGETKNIPMKYFSATFYKKGTVHLTFTCPELIERFNIYAAQHKAWLPPCYGKKTYKNMTDEEKAVVDSFQGAEAYNNVMAKAGYYLAPVTNNQMLMLGEGNET